MLDAAGANIRGHLLELFRHPIDSELSNDAFDAIAREIFAFQYERNAPYAAYCARRNRTPETVAHWTDIPPVPTAAFKAVDLVSGDIHDTEAIFRTSGTTAGDGKRGVHYVLDVALYEASLLPNFKARLLPDVPAMPILSLIPPATELQDSSLAHMVAAVSEMFGDARSGYYATVADGIDEVGLELALSEHIAADRPVCLLGTSFSFVHWLDSMRARNVAMQLPSMSRLMDTGGYKGRTREVPAEEMLASYSTLLGLPAYACVNEYGMTELCSQMYDTSLSDHVASGGSVSELGPPTRHKRPPPWLRARIVDGLKLEPVPDGTPGLVQLFDLANVGSVMAIQTEDMAVRDKDGYVLLGRAKGAQPRGCSIAMDDLLQAMR